MSMSSTFAATIKSPSGGYVLETNATPPPSPTPTPTPFQPQIQAGFDLGGKVDPLRLFLSTDLIDFGPLTATNPVKREITITLSGDIVGVYSLFTSQDHQLQTPPSDENVAQTIPDTTCDNGSCTEKRTADWINPLTFGFGFRIGANRSENFSNGEPPYQQFPDLSQNESPIEIPPGTMTVKLNINKNQILPQGKNYANTIRFLVIPKY